DRAEHREERTARTRDRIDEREITGAISRGERREVQRLQPDRDRDEYERRPAQLGFANYQDADRERREHDRADHICEPQEWRVRTRALRQEIPRRVKDGGCEDETEGKGAHRQTLAKLNVLTLQVTEKSGRTERHP